MTVKRSVSAAAAMAIAAAIDFVATPWFTVGPAVRKPKPVNEKKLAKRRMQRTSRRRNRK